MNAKSNFISLMTTDRIINIYKKVKAEVADTDMRPLVFEWAVKAHLQNTEEVDRARLRDGAEFVRSKKQRPHAQG